MLCEFVSFVGEKDKDEREQDRDARKDPPFMQKVSNNDGHSVAV